MFFSGNTLEDVGHRFYDMDLHIPGSGFGAVIRPSPRRNLASLINGINEANPSKYYSVVEFWSTYYCFTVDKPNLASGRVLFEKTRIRVFLFTTKDVKEGDIAVYRYAAGGSKTALFANNTLTHLVSPRPLETRRRRG